MDTFKVIGVMSGSSMDGLDLAYCMLSFNGRWMYEIVHAETISYSEEWMEKLAALHDQPIAQYPETDFAYGQFIGDRINDFMQKYQLQPDLIASHGHTVFHRPDKGFTSQIGNGAAIHARTGIKVISDFRTLDVALGGQGAPLVPIGDELLFGNYGACLNLGGFSNISFLSSGLRVAFDISPCNFVLNDVAGMLGKPYDEDGKIAASGAVNMELLEKLNGLDFYKKKGAKSLGREWVAGAFTPLTHPFISDPALLLATLNEHIAQQITDVISASQAKDVLITGGGAFNLDLLRRMKRMSAASLEVPGKMVVNYKEALIFALLGVLRLKGETNTLRSVTGARRDSSGGAIFG